MDATEVGWEEVCDTGADSQDAVSGPRETAAADPTEVRFVAAFACVFPMEVRGTAVLCVGTGLAVSMLRRTAPAGDPVMVVVVDDAPAADPPLGPVDELRLCLLELRPRVPTGRAVVAPVG